MDIGEKKKSKGKKVKDKFQTTNLEQIKEDTLEDSTAFEKSE